MNTNRNQSCGCGQGMNNAYRSTQENRMSGNMRAGNQGYTQTNMNRNAQSRVESDVRAGTYNRMHQNMNQRTISSDCGCNLSDPCGIAGTNRIDQFPVGMAYIPWQEFKDLYDPHQGLARGTLFKELDYPFYGKRGNC